MGDQYSPTICEEGKREVWGCGAGVDAGRPGSSSMKYRIKRLEEIGKFSKWTNLGYDRR